MKGLSMQNFYNVEISSEHIYYYYLRDEKSRPMVTVCLMEDYGEKGKFARGVAICSLKDNPVKNTGKDKAFGRAFKALSHKTSDMIISRTEAFDVMNRIVCENPSYGLLIDDICNKGKSYYGSELNKIEMRLLTNPEEAK